MWWSLLCWMTSVSSHFTIQRQQQVAFMQFGIITKCLFATARTTKSLNKLLLNFYFNPNKGTGYCDDCVFLFVCVFVYLQAHHWNMSDHHQIFCVCYLYSRGLILLWQHCDMLCISGFMDQAYRSILLQRVMSLRCHLQAIAAVSYWLHRLLCNSWPYRARAAGNQGWILQYIIALCKH